MATVYSSEVAVGTYNRIRIKCDYSGTSATLTVQFRRTSAWTGAWSGSSATLNFNNQNKAAAYYYSGYVGTSWDSCINLVTVSGYTIPTSGGTFSWSFNNPGSSSVLGCSGTITIPSQGTAPTGLTLSNINPGIDTVSATVAVTGWGGIGDASTRYRELNVWAYGGQPTGKRRYQKKYGNTMSSVITTTNNSEVAGGLNITPNTRYTLTTYATNGTISTGQTNSTNIVTRAAAPIVSAGKTTGNSVVISYSTTADGGVYNKSIEYSIDGGTTWIIVTTVSTGSATSGTYTISGLSPNTTYNIQTRVSTTVGITSGDTLTVVTSRIPCLYGSVNGTTERIAKLYGSVNGETKQIIKLYGSVNGKTKRIF